MKTNKLVILSILWIFVIFFSILLINYVINKIRIRENLDNKTVTTNFIITLTTDEKNTDTEQTNVNVGNGVPGRLEYNITSLTGDNVIRDSDIIVFKENLPKQVNLKSVNSFVESKDKETQEKHSFIVISPKSKKTFPKNFSIKIENNVGENKTQYDLWGDSYINTLKKRPIGNVNTIIGPHNLSSYINYTDKPVFSYDNSVFNTKCFKENEGCEINKLDIGNKIINVIQSGDIFDNNGKKIGNVTKTTKLENVSMETIQINIENTTDITGILIYMGPPISL
jgi:hypothetical protein